MRNDTAAKQLATNAVLDALDNAGISVEVVSDEAASEMPGRNEVKAVSNNKEYLGTTDHVQFMRMGGKKKSTLETASPDNQDHQTVVSSADGANVLNDLDNLVKEYEISKGNKPNTFIGDVSKALGAKRQVRCWAGTKPRQNPATRKIWGQQTTFSLCEWVVKRNQHSKPRPLIIRINQLSFQVLTVQRY